MLGFLSENWGTILVVAIVAAIVVGILVNSYRKKKSGCGGSCDCCPSNGICHPKQ